MKSSRSLAAAGWAKLPDARRAARTAVELDPDGAGALGNLAAVLLEQGKFDAARAAVAKAIMADPDDEKNKAVLRAIEREASQKRVMVETPREMRRGMRRSAGTEQA